MRKAVGIVTGIPLAILHMLMLYSSDMFELPGLAIWAEILFLYIFPVIYYFGMTIVGKAIIIKETVNRVEGTTIYMDTTYDNSSLGYGIWTGLLIYAGTFILAVFVNKMLIGV
jgi:hypothetical protein